MADMLVKLYDLPPLSPAAAGLEKRGVSIQRAMAADRRRILDWVEAHFERGWADECGVTFARRPITTFIAVENGRLLGFACHEATCKNFFGPTGVLPTARGRGIGRALLLACLHDMAAQGYAYAIIGGVGPADFYTRAVGAALIPDSTPGIYGRLIGSNPS